MKQKSFTLIELLVVIAIIGVLAATIVVALNSARKKAHDARIKTDLSQISKLVQLWIDDHENLDNFCDNASDPGTNLGKLIEDIKKNGGTEPICNAKGDAYAVSSPLNNPGGAWCVDNDYSDNGTALSTNCVPLAKNPKTPTNLSYMNITIRGSTDFSQAQIDFLATHYDVILIKGWFAKSKVDALKNAAAKNNRNIKVLMYTNGSFSLAYKPPDEVAYAHNKDSTQSNNRITETDFNQGWNLMDLCSQGDKSWRNYFVSQALANINDRGADGIMVDDMGMASGIKNISRISNMPQHQVGGAWTDYSNQEWYGCGKDFLSYVNSNLNSKTVIFNGLYRNAPYYGLQYLDVTSGGIDEGWITKDYMSFISEDNWKMKLNQAVKDVNNGKTVFPTCIINNPAATINDRLYCYTSYLLMNKTGNVTYIGPGYENRETSIYYMPEMGVDIGAPIKAGASLDDYRNDTFSVYERDYSGGKIIVNPSANPKNYSLGKEYYLVEPSGNGLVNSDGTVNGNLSYKKVTEVTVAPQTGVILLSGL